MESVSILCNNNMEDICPICFYTNGKHQEWCPNYIDVPDFLSELFKSQESEK
jgi:hypothetical protein